MQICPIENASRYSPTNWRKDLLLISWLRHYSRALMHTISIKCSLVERLLHRFSRSKLHHGLVITVHDSSRFCYIVNYRTSPNTCQVFNLLHIGECLWVCPSSGDGNKRRIPFSSSSSHIFAGNSLYLSHFSATPDKWQLWRYMRCTMPQHYTVNVRVNWTESVLVYVTNLLFLDVCTSLLWQLNSVFSNT
jgi:hypothetical protein